MDRMTPDRWQATESYLAEVFGREDAHLAQLQSNAIEAGLPDIAVDAVVGRLLLLLTGLTRGRRAIELGTLGGYSGIWMARGLQPDGKLITLEIDEKHADFAQDQFTQAGVADRVEIRRGDALDTLGELKGELAPRSVDLVFLDADKERYPTYWKLLRPMIAVGGLLVMDNALGSVGWWIDDLSSPSARAADETNRLLADDPDFEAVAFPLRQGIMIARRIR